MGCFLFIIIISLSDLYIYVKIKLQSFFFFSFENEKLVWHKNKHHNKICTSYCYKFQCWTYSKGGVNYYLVSEPQHIWPSLRWGVLQILKISIYHHHCCTFTFWSAPNALFPAAQYFPISLARLIIKQKNTSWH